MTSKVKDDFLLCSQCFSDQGLKLNAEQIGKRKDIICKNCKSKDGSKLIKEDIKNLCYIFFVRGTIENFEYGGFPVIQMNEAHYGKTNVDLSQHLEKDIKLIEEAGKIGLFYYPPRFWMFGEIEPLKSLQTDSRDVIIQEILKKYPTRYLNEDDHFYRLRKNPEKPENSDEYDTPPAEFIGNGRLDDIDFPLLYGSQDLQVCIHECRITVEDKIFVSTLKPNRKLKLLDLTELIYEEGVTEFESLDLAIHFLFLAKDHSYEICRKIARKAFEVGFDGIIYPSYFSYIRNGLIPFDTVYGISIRRIKAYNDYAKAQIIPNLAIFGRPIKEDILKVECINKVLINQIFYQTSLGPAYHNGFGDSSDS